MSDNSILRLFDGMNTQQAKEFTRRIIPALETIRAEVLQSEPTKRTQPAYKATSTTNKRGANGKTNDNNTL